MSIQSAQILGDDGKPMTPDQVELSRLKKANATLQQKLADIEKRLENLEAKNLAADNKPIPGGL